MRNQNTILGSSSDDEGPNADDHIIASRQTGSRSCKHERRVEMDSDDEVLRPLSTLKRDSPDNVFAVAGEDMEKTTVVEAPSKRRNPRRTTRRD